jgi:hypothetical protein
MRILPFVLLLAVACARVMAPPPPDTAPVVSEETRVVGAPITVAARAARTLQDYGFATKRFSSDSTWGWNANSKTAARLRYTLPSRDSTRVLLELWGKCERRQTCMRGDVAAIFARLAEEEAPPPE